MVVGPQDRQRRSPLGNDPLVPPPLLGAAAGLLVQPVYACADILTARGLLVEIDDEALPELALDDALPQQLLVSYSYFHPEEACFVNRVASLTLPDGWLSTVTAGGEPDFGDWRVVFETAPCLPIVDGAGFPFTGHQAGGQFAIAPSGELYLSVGDFGFDGTEGKLPPYPIVPDNSYGRVLQLTPGDGMWASEEVANGLRNPQGLTIDPQGRMWETEHGAMGGDELNLIRRGGNYGWPAVTLGVNYVEPKSDDKYWPFNAETGSHTGYYAPTFAWVPSIAPSNIRAVSGLSPRWDGDLIVGALKDRSITRLQLNGNRVIVAERIDVGRRVRYLEIGHGKLYVLFDYGELAVLTPHEMTESYADLEPLKDQVYDPENPSAVTVIANASILVSRGCIECHSGPGTPKLNGLYEKPIAAQRDIRYSPALASKGGTWTEANLRAFLTDPQAFAPGTEMPKRALSEKDIEEIIWALKLPDDW